MAIRTLTLTMGAAPTTTYLGDTAAAAARNAAAAYHLTPIADGLKDNENVFTGFTSTAGFTDVTVTNATDMMAEAASTTIGQKKRIICNWTGLSESTSVQALGPASASYTANASVDWGYNRPDHSVWIVPAPGQSPILGNTSSPSSLQFLGFNWIHFDGMGFATRILFTQSSFRPGLPIAAITNCTFTDVETPEVGLNVAIGCSPARSLHIEGCTFVRCFGVAAGNGVEFFRAWNNTISEGGTQDIFNISGITAGTLKEDWEPKAWVFGNLVYDHDTTARSVEDGGTLHTDFFQCHEPTAQQNADHILVEFNVVELNSSNVEGVSQSQFLQAEGVGRVGGSYDPAVGNLDMVSNWVMHNNIGILAAFQAPNIQDPSNKGQKYIMNNTLLRHGTPIDGTPAVRDTTPTMSWVTNQVGDGSGVLKVSGNAVGLITSGVFDGENISGNLLVDARLSTSEVDPQDFFEGNGTWGTTPIQGFQTYTPASQGAANAAAARSAIISFVEPKAAYGSWNDLSGTKYGVTNPANWPATPQATIA